MIAIPEDKAGNLADETGDLSAPGNTEHTPEAVERYVSRVGDFFKSGGVLESASHSESFDFEVRPQQTAMADAVAHALVDRKHLAAEAGTGVGKTFAYLVPLILYGHWMKRQVAVATYTISLQEQLLFKDVPLLQRHLGIDFSVALCKGRHNYICLRRLFRREPFHGDLFNRPQLLELDRIREWADATEDGSLSDMERQPPTDVWTQVCSEHDNCLGRSCEWHSRCFVMRARSRAFDANVLILNHHLFFSDLSLRAEMASFLPSFEILVLDEAHCLEAVAGEHLGIRLSHFGVHHWLKRLYHPDTGKGLLVGLKAGDLAEHVARVWGAADRFFTEIKQWANLSGRETKRVVTEPLQVSVPLCDEITRLTEALHRFAEPLEDVAGAMNAMDVKTELAAIERRGTDLRDMLSMFLSQEADGHVYWVELEGSRRAQMALHSAPIEIGSLMETTLFRQVSPVIMTSATLSIEGCLGYFKERIGAKDSRELVVDSPFDYSRQMRLWIVRDMPDPNDGERYVPAVTEAVGYFIRKTQGHAFVLFTSAEMMRQVAAQIGPFCDRSGIVSLVQGEGMPRHVMLERFRKADSAVLLGVDSFWMGVDVRGDALTNVIITRLPFAVPDEPIVKARCDRITERGGDPFKEYSLPEAILKFRQGVGRLIRTSTDQGLIAVLDSRVVTRWYGRQFIQAIPECPVELIGLQDTREGIVVTDG